MAMFVQYIFLLNTMVSIKCLAIFGVGTCFMLFPLARDVKHNLRAINQAAKMNKNQNKRPKIVEELAQFVGFHSRLFQLSIK